MSEPIMGAAVKPRVQFKLFEKLDIRVGLIELVEDLPNSEKMLKLSVDFGDHKRTVLAGMKKDRADIQEVNGKQALFIVNIKPRKILGVFSEALLLDVGFLDGISPVMLVPEKPVPNGTRCG